MIAGYFDNDHRCFCLATNGSTYYLSDVEGSNSPTVTPKIVPTAAPGSDY